MHEKEQARQRTSNASFVGPLKRQQAMNKTSQLFSVLESSTFCLKAIITAVGYEHRHEVGAARIFPGFAAVVVSPLGQKRLDFVACNAFW